MDRRAALGRISALPLLATFANGCAEFDDGYPDSAIPRVGAVAWPEGRERTALVLGSGGPRGFAHVGVLKVLEAAGIEPALIVGSSAGAIVGSLYAAKMSGIEIERRALEMGLTDIADPALFQPTRLIGRAMQNFINAAVGNALIEGLPRRFCAVAAPVGKNELVAFTAGHTGAAVRASAALPSMFLPCIIGGVPYEDGDMVSPVPIRIARALGATRVVAIDVSAFIEDTPTSVPEKWMARDAQRRAVIDDEAKDADLLLRIRTPYYAGASREYRETLIRLADAQTRTALPSVVALLK